MDKSGWRTADKQPAGREGSADMSLAKLLQQVALTRAAELARSGHYESAELVLRELMLAEKSPATLDMLARIRAQQGRLEESRALWQRVLRMEPSDAAALAGVARIEHIERHRRPARASREKGKGHG